MDNFNLRNNPGPEDENISPEARRATVSYRLALMMALMLSGLALLLTVEWPNTFHLCSLTVAIPLVWPAIGLLTVAMTLGAVLIFYPHPSLQDVSAFLTLWPLPALTTCLAVLFLRQVTSEMLWGGGIIVAGLILYILFRLEYRVMHREGEDQWAEWGIQMMAYLLALAYFVLICRAGWRVFLSALAMMAVGGILALRLLRSSTPEGTGQRQGGMCALIIGLILGEVTWALSYLPSRGTIEGMLLFLTFYVFTGLARRGLRDRLTRSALLEYGVVALLGLGLLIRFG
ncbi:MAG: hypothetical protein U9Q78_02480 [Chloroflexota bacterium]|nr:hypothetical protein [Chloroflexota bacterium]